MFIDPDRFPFCTEVLFAFDEILAELLEHGPGRFVPWHQAGAYVGSWDVLPLVAHDVPIDCPELEEAARANAAAFTTTLDVLERIPGFVMAAFSRLGPHTEVIRHKDDDRPPVFRCHLGLIVPAGCTLEIDGEILQHSKRRWVGFHGAVEHLARNTSDEQRVTLLVDVLRSAYPDALSD